MTCGCSNKSEAHVSQCIPRIASNTIVMLMIIMVIPMNTILKAPGCLFGASKNIEEDAARADKVKLWEHVFELRFELRLLSGEVEYNLNGAPFPARSVASMEDADIGGARSISIVGFSFHRSIQDQDESGNSCRIPINLQLRRWTVLNSIHWERKKEEESVTLGAWQ
ncbi:hypothetical protein V1477_019526 [Vespula maculifrons]|uniref:Uncharacterized protein n=2 Tax=Vespula TaxID=7451 RepID=A0A834J4C7_VESVU|nr:hypothetical protein HZH66_014267 [Vespula vulgaris]